MQRHTNFIAGKWVPPQAGGFYETHNPAHPKQVLGEFPSSLTSDAEAAVDAAEAALPAWEETPDRSGVPCCSGLLNYWRIPKANWRRSSPWNKGKLWARQRARSLVRLSRRAIWLEKPAALSVRRFRPSARVFPATRFGNL